MGIEIQRAVLLTGAGFTKDLGGYLAQEMWAQIFNSPTIARYPRLIHILKHDVNFDYESVYDKVVYGQETEEVELEAFSDALYSAYQVLDDRLRGLEGNQSPGSGVDLDKLCAFLQLFGGTGNVRGFFFTLNQDLFIERWLAGKELHFSGKLQLWIPGIDNHVSGKNGAPLEKGDFLTLPPESAMARHRKRNEENISIYGRFQYLKLHGSWNWRTSDGKSAMAIGHAKSVLLEREPLLKWHLQTFNHVVTQNDSHLLVIGYGFQDPHINDVIAEGIEKHNLRLFVVDPQSPQNFKQMLMSHVYGSHGLCGGFIWDNGVAGYFQATVSQLFPRDGKMHLSESNLAKQIRELIFY
jgi:hypothetical protein